MGPLLAIALLVTAPADAKSWCAAPLVVHEWGVQVFHGPDAEPQPSSLPGWFHRHPAGTAPADSAVPVRSLPADGGEREIPVLQFYSPKLWGVAVPVALELGFTQGRPSVWYPQADRVYPPRVSGDAGVQLAWDALSLEADARGEPRSTEAEWVRDLRAVDGALWVSRGGETERFLFYEAETREQPAVRIEQGRAFNDGPWPVHDLAVVRRDGEAVSVARLDTLPAGGDARLVFEDVGDAGATLRPWLAQRLLAAETAVDLQEWSMDMDDCVMMRDPAVPVSSSSGHGLYRAEIDVLLDLWQDRLFGQQGTVLVYRDDPAALDAMVPMAVYTDMHHFVQLSRTGLVLWEGISD